MYHISILLMLSIIINFIWFEKYFIYCHSFKLRRFFMAKKILCALEKNLYFAAVGFIVL